MKMTKPLIGVSSCLLGENVRYDGSNKNNNIVVHELSQHFELRAFCPEVAAGMGVPREPIKVIKTASSYACVGTKTENLDVTEALKACATGAESWLSQIQGYIFKARSPSCGLNDVNIFEGEEIIKLGRGIFAQAISEKYPKLPIIDENSLADEHERHAFIEKVKAYKT